MLDRQSAETDPKKRLAQVWEIQKKLEEEAARPTLTWRVDNFTHWPQVKNLIPHNNFYNYGRLQEVWLDK
jgi:peptide/nickel transport system substrate-binding protein